MKIKVCGITNNRNLREIAELRPDYMGFIFHSGSPRDVTEKIGSLLLGTIPSGIKKVAVVVDRSLDEVRELVKKYGFETVQLHGDESPDYCNELRSCCEVIKVFRVNDSLPGNMNYFEGKCDLFLFDARGKYQGGNGIKFNHSILSGYDQSTPYILSGGIGDTDLPYLQSIRLKGIAGVDLNSRFEISPGYKSIAPLREFIKKLRNDVGIKSN